MIIKQINARSGEGKTRELIGEALFSKGKTVVVSTELDSTEIFIRLLSLNVDMDNMRVGDDIYKLIEKMESIELKDRFMTVLLDCSEISNQDMTVIIGKFASLGTKKLVYTRQLNAIGQYEC